MKIAYGVCSLGIGHATRSFPVIRGLIDEGHNVVIISHGRALNILRKEFPYLKYYDIVDYPVRYPAEAHQFIPYFITKSPKLVKYMIYNHRVFLDIDKQENFDIILSDSRYDIFNRFKPSYLIIHQLRIMLKFASLRGGIMFFNHYMSRFFTKILVPDFESNSLSGDMSHNLRFISPDKVEYVGILSPFKKMDVDRDIDVLISISGPEPQRTIFENKVLNELDMLSGKIVVTLGKPDEDDRIEGNVSVYSYVDFNTRQQLMNRAKVIISRSGYSTIMDMYITGGKATFIPTPGQPEQIYLAKYLNSRGITAYATQENMIADMIEMAKKYRGFKGGYDIKNSLERIWEIIF